MRTTANKSTAAFVPSFRSGVASVVRPWKSGAAYRKVVMQRTNNGLADDWRAIGSDFRTAITKYKADTTWRNK